MKAMHSCALLQLAVALATSGFKSWGRPILDMFQFSLNPGHWAPLGLQQEREALTLERQYAATASSQNTRGKHASSHVTQTGLSAVPLLVVSSLQALQASAHVAYFLFALLALRQAALQRRG